MRSETTGDKVREFMKALGKGTSGRGRVYLTGGATAVLFGWRDSTVDIDLKADPEPGRFFEAIAALKDQLDINLELAAPDDFIPPLPGWRDRSSFIASYGGIDYFHYDFYAQALSKVERGHGRDLDDVRAMLSRGLVEPGELRRLFAEVAPNLIRYPAIDQDVFLDRLEDLLSEPGTIEVSDGRAD